MTKLKVLYVLHNHPSVHPGGAEAYAFELYEALSASEEVEPALVARIGPNVAAPRSGHAGTPFSAVSEDPNQYFVFTETEHFDFFHMTSRDKSLYTKHFASFLTTLAPDVVHFQHTQFIGCDLVSLVRRVLPTTAIVYTLHEFLPICHRDGQMVRTIGGELCNESSPRRCSECFPSHTPQEFFLRKRYIQSHFAHVDVFLAPSQFLLERYVDWGLPRERIRFEDYGRVRAPRGDDLGRDAPHDRLGFFGQVNPFKGVNVALKAMGLVKEQLPTAHLWIHGANLKLQSEAFQEEFEKLLDEVDENVTYAGPYRPQEIAKLMAGVDWIIVPSVWWENSPLVIQEAFMSCRPVVCSDIGGMAEKVENGVNGLHFRAGDPASLAETLRRALSSKGLWDQLRGGIPEIFGMEDHIDNLVGTYRQLLAERSDAVAAG